MEKLAPDKMTIGVSGCSPRTPSVRAMMRQISDEGGVPFFLRQSTPSLRAAVQCDIRAIDALVLMGNTLDLDPNSYIHRYPENHPSRCIHPATKSEMTTQKGKMRASYEEAMLKEALATGMPVLGICGGMQRINIMRGDTLHQHIPDLVGCDRHMQHKQGIAPHVPSIPIVIKEYTLLAQIASGIRMAFAKGHAACDAKVIMENSMHHQSVDRIGDGLRVCALTDTARRKDGTSGYLAEAVESDPEGPLAQQFVLGVQWHPEFGASSLGQHIVQHVLRAARQYRTAHRALLRFRRIDSITRIR